MFIRLLIVNPKFMMYRINMILAHILFNLCYLMFVVDFIDKNHTQEYQFYVECSSMIKIKSMGRLSI
jgi:hypothetical protein